MGEHEQCMNTIGSYSCACLPGYYWSNPSEMCVGINGGRCLLPFSLLTLYFFSLFCCVPLRGFD